MQNDDCRMQTENKGDADSSFLAFLFSWFCICR